MGVRHLDRGIVAAGPQCLPVKWLTQVLWLVPGTHDIHALILGRAITGLQAFTPDN